MANGDLVIFDLQRQLRRPADRVTFRQFRANELPR
jgi:hypothetical protein